MRVPRNNRNAARPPSFQKDEAASPNLGPLLVTVLIVILAAGGAFMVIFSGSSLGREGSGAAVAATDRNWRGLNVFQAGIHQTEDGSYELTELMGPTDTTGPVDVESLTLTLQVGDQTANVTYGKAAGPKQFTVDLIRDTDKSFPTLGSGDLAHFTINLNQAGLSPDTASQLRQSQRLGSKSAPAEVFEIPPQVDGGILVQLGLAK